MIAIKTTKCQNGRNTYIIKQTKPTSSNNVITELRRSKYNYEKDLAAKVKNDNKLLWSYVHSKVKTKSNINLLDIPNGSYTNDHQEKAEILNGYLASVFVMEGSEALPEFEERNFVDPVIKKDIYQEMAYI